MKESGPAFQAPVDCADGHPGSDGVRAAVTILNPSDGLRIAVPINDAAQIESALAPVWREPGGGLIVMPDAITMVLPRAIIALAAQHHFPAVYPYRDEVVDGGLMILRCRYGRSASPGTLTLLTPTFGP